MPPSSGHNADDVAPHGCTTLRYYGRGGWRCIECFQGFYVSMIPDEAHASASNIQRHNDGNE